MKPSVLASQYLAERSRLLQAIAAFLESDPHVAAAWLFGSLGRGDEDELSDLDLFVIMEDAFMPGDSGRLRAYTSQVGTPLLFVEAPQNAPQAGAYLMACYDAPTAPHIVDWYWQPRSLAVLPGQVRLLFDRAGLPRQDQPVRFGRQAAHPQTVQSPGQILSFFWMMLMIAAKYACRQPEQEELALLPYLLDPIAKIRQFLELEQPASSAAQPPQPAAAQKMDRLRGLADEMSRLMNAVSERGQQVPALVLPGAYRYLAMVEDILEEQLPRPGL